MPFDLDTRAADVLMVRISNIFSPAVADQGLLYAGQRVGVAAEEIVQENLYPPASGKALPIFYTRTRKDGTTFQSKFKSLAQQRKVMALAAKGLIPYNRTGKLGQSITSAASIAGAGVVLIRVGSNLSYAGYVIDENSQSHYHMGTWTPIQRDLAAGIPKLNQVAVSSLKSWAEKKIKGNG